MRNICYVLQTPDLKLGFTTAEEGGKALGRIAEASIPFHQGEVFSLEAREGEWDEILEGFVTKDGELVPVASYAEKKE